MGATLMALNVASNKAPNKISDMASNKASNMVPCKVMQDLLCYLTGSNNAPTKFMKWTEISKCEEKYHCVLGTVVGMMEMRHNCP